MSKYLIDNWRDIPKMLTAWVAFACIGFSTFLDAQQQVELLRLLGVPEHRVLGVVGGLVLLARGIKQFGPKSVQPQKD